MCPCNAVKSATYYLRVFFIIIIERTLKALILLKVLLGSSLGVHQVL